jgi:BirA family biotin operon repressor/biotin-[acetyl-CoA-carboxylase] ligase
MSREESLFRASLGSLLRERGKAVEFGDVILVFASLESTNEVALAQARKGLPHGSLVLADEQTAGRGRRGRSWLSPPGLGLYLTTLVRPPEGVSLAAALLPLAASVATAEALREDPPGSSVPARIRWPNDLYVEGRKLSGILCEGTFTGSRLEYMAVGVGINLNQQARHFASLAERATSMRIFTGREQDRAEIAARVVERLEYWWGRLLTAPGEVPGRWRELAEGDRGAKVLVERDGARFEATTAGLTDDGGLQVQLGDGRLLTLHSAELVSLRALET